MSETYSGGCACGAIRYEIAGEPVSTSHCQCRQCQRASGTGHGSYLTFVGAPVELRGRASTWRDVGENGTPKDRGFCSTCGAPVYLTFATAADVFVVTAASLDDPARFNPAKVMWASAGQAWDPVDPALPRFEKMPPRES
jgi:hypothetical protein